jgi:hypothetical protein
VHVLPGDFALLDSKGRVNKHEIPKSAWAITPCMASGVPIHRVRMLEESDTFRRVSPTRAYQFVKPGGNHHIVYRTSDSNAQSKWVAEVVTMWDSIERARQRIPIIDRSDKDQTRFVMSLSRNEVFEIDGEDGRRLLCVVRKMDQVSKRVDYKLHNDARKASELNKENLYLSPDRMRRLRARKVAVDPLGRIRDAND